MCTCSLFVFHQWIDALLWFNWFISCYRHQRSLGSSTKQCRSLHEFLEFSRPICCPHARPHGILRGVYLSVFRVFWKGLLATISPSSSSRASRGWRVRIWGANPTGEKACHQGEHQGACRRGSDKSSSPHSNRHFKGVSLFYFMLHMYLEIPLVFMLN